jgi:uncharacterized protein (TIGR01777 family)
MKVLVAGGSGFIGRYLCWALEAAGHQALVLTRRGAAGALLWDGAHLGPWAQALEGCHAVVNLAGAPIAEGRWSQARKRELRESRLDCTRALVEAMGAAKQRPKVFINSSAVGYYGDRKEEVLDEASAAGDGFLAELCLAWERQAKEAALLGVQTVLLRTGIVLGREGGALAKMAPLFRAFLGGPLGSGKQWMPWIAREDLAGLILHLIEQEASGPFIGAAPNPVTNRVFSSTLGKILGRPSRLAAPAFALKLALGEMAGELLLSSQKAVPKNALAAGYRFRYPELEGSLKACLQ